jgi:voltage-gated potassium channel
LLELFAELAWKDRRTILVVNALVLVAFLVDLIVELAVVSNRRAYLRHDWASAAIVVAQMIAILPIAGFNVLRVVACLSRGAALISAVRKEGLSIVRERPIGFAVLISGLTWMSGAVAFRFAEDSVTVTDAMYWSLGTMTTAGSGSVVATTEVSTYVAMSLMIVGIGAFSVVTGSVAGILLRGQNNEVERRPSEVSEDPVRIS